MFDDNNAAGDCRPNLPSWITVEGDTGPRRPDLTSLTTEAMLTEQVRAAEAEKRGVPLKHFDPNWRPKRQKGEKIDKDSEEHQQAVKACLRGLPAFPDITWMEVQLFDNGPGDGQRNHVQYRLKFTATSAAPGALMAPGTDKRALSADQFCSLANAKRFRANMLRKKERHALSAEEWAMVDKMKADVVTAAADAPDAPEPLFGALFYPLYGEGLLRTPGQFASVIWVAAAEEWVPLVALFQYFRHRDGRTEFGMIPMGPPPQIKPNRKPSACRWYGRHESDGFRALINDPHAEVRQRLQTLKDKS